MTSDVIALPPVAYKVLDALDTYRFLTVKQMLRLGIAKDEGHLRKTLARMVGPPKGDDPLPRPKEIGVLGYGVIPGIGKLSRLYYLTKQGADLLDEYRRGDPPARPERRARAFLNDYFHRVETINFHITLAQFAKAEGHEITNTRQYFTWVPGNRGKSGRTGTSIDLRPGFIDPDSIYWLRAPDGRERLLLVEIERGVKVAKAADKIIKYAKAIDSGTINQALNYPDTLPARVLWLFENPRTLELTQERLADDLWVQQYWRHFFLRTIEGCEAQTLVPGWRRPLAGQDVADLF